MTYGQKYVIRWTPRLKRKLLTIVAIIFIIGIVLGFMLGRVSAVDAKDDVAEVTKAPVTSTPLIVEVTEPPTESTAEQVVIVPVEKQVEYFDVPLSKDLQDYIFTLCEQNNVPVALIMAMIETESSFRPNIISSTNDYGLMQINSVNHEWLSEE